MKTIVSALLLVAAGSALADSPGDPPPPTRSLAQQAAVTPAAFYPAGTNQLPLPSWQEVSQYSCGLGVLQQPYMVSIDSKFIIHGELTASTYCSSGGRGGHSVHHFYTYSIEWDYCGNYKLLPYNGGPMDQTAVVTDSFGNTAYVTDPNQNFSAVPWLNLNQLPPNATCLE
jgi:hypothetical protein